jgi:hypothetical protein
MELIEWCESYFRHKDVLERKIEEVARQGEQLIIRRKDGNMVVICQPDFNKISFNDTDAYDKVCTVSLHTKKNLDDLIHRWDECVQMGNLLCIFADPDANMKWIVSPANHDRITHGDLKKGLKSLFDNCS